MFSLAFFGNSLIDTNNITKRLLQTLYTQNSGNSGSYRTMYIEYKEVNKRQREITFKNETKLQSQLLVVVLGQIISNLQKK